MCADNTKMFLGTLCSILNDTNIMTNYIKKYINCINYNINEISTVFANSINIILHIPCEMYIETDNELKTLSEDLQYLLDNRDLHNSYMKMLHGEYTEFTYRIYDAIDIKKNNIELMESNIFVGIIKRIYDIYFRKINKYIESAKMNENENDKYNMVVDCLKNKSIEYEYDPKVMANIINNNLKLLANKYITPDCPY